jgi:transposase-like protein
VGFSETKLGRERDGVVRKTYSVAFKEKMVTKLLGIHATSANRLAQETGVSQAALSQWRRQARSLPGMGPEKRPRRTWTLDRKVEILAAAAKLEGSELKTYLEREQVTLAELDRWRTALHDDGGASVAATKRIKALERELARKEKALAEAAALLILKKKLEDYYSAEKDENTDEDNEK